MFQCKLRLCTNCKENIIPITPVKWYVIYVISWIVFLVLAFFNYYILKIYSDYNPIIAIIITSFFTIVICQLLSKKGECPRCGCLKLEQYQDEYYTHKMYEDASKFPWVVSRGMPDEIATIIRCTFMLFSPMMILGPFTFLYLRGFKKYLPLYLIPDNTTIDAITSNRYQLDRQYMMAKETHTGFLFRISRLRKKTSMFIESFRNNGDVSDNQSLTQIGNDMSGLEFEQYCADLLRNNGYYVKVTKSSGDYGVDLVATDGSGIRYAIQCKYYSNPVNLKAVQEVCAGINRYGCDYGVVMTNSTFTKSAIELARDNNIKLWDRNYIKKFGGVL